MTAPFSPRWIRNQHGAGRFFGTYAGTVSVAEFMSDENFERIMAA